MCVSKEESSKSIIKNGKAESSYAVDMDKLWDNSLILSERRRTGKESYELEKKRMELISTKRVDDGNVWVKFEDIKEENDFLLSHNLVSESRIESGTIDIYKNIDDGIFTIKYKANDTAEMTIISSVIPDDAFIIASHKDWVIKCNIKRLEEK